MNITEKELRYAAGRLRGRVHAFAAPLVRVYALLQWQWNRPSLALAHCPDTAEIEDELHSLITTCERGGGAVRSGGLKVWITRDPADGMLEFGMSCCVRDVGYVGTSRERQKSNES